MAGPNSLVLLCFLFVIAASQLASCKFSVFYYGCRAIGGSKESCAKKCHCSLPANQLAATEEAVLEEEAMKRMEELISLNDKLRQKCKYQPCYRACRAVGGSKEYCARRCHCTQLTFVPSEPGQKTKMTEALAAEEMEVDYNKAEGVLEEMTMEELISLNGKLYQKCQYQPCYRACRAIGGSKNSCAKKCHCTQLTFVPNELGQMTEALAAAEMEVDYNKAEGVLEKMTVEELISLNDKLRQKCQYQPCYRACRAVGGSKDYCAKKCHCTQLTFVPNELGQMTEALAAAEMEVGYSKAEGVLEEMTMEEPISLNDKLKQKCPYQPCYRACRAVGGSKYYCAKKCHCTQLTFVPNELGQMTEALAAAEMEADYNKAEGVAEEMTMEEPSLNNKLKQKCQYQPCYRACRAIGGSKDSCARRCNCSQVKDVPATNTDVKKDVDDEASTASTE